MEEAALVFEDNTITPFEWKPEHYAIAASTVILGGG